MNRDLKNVKNVPEDTKNTPKVGVYSSIKYFVS